MERDGWMKPILERPGSRLFPALPQPLRLPRDPGGRD